MYNNKFMKPSNTIITRLHYYANSLILDNKIIPHP